MRVLLNITVRETLPSDHTAIASLLRQFGYEMTGILVHEKIETLRRSPVDNLLVATVEETVVGIIRVHALPLFHEDGYLGRVTSLMIDEHHRGCGVGSALISAAENWFERVGCVKSQATTGEYLPARRI